MTKHLFFLFFFLNCSLCGFAQKNIEQLEEDLENNYGVEKLITLNQLTEQYQATNIRKAIRYGKQAVDIAENLYPEATPQLVSEQYFLKVDAYNLLGQSHYIKENYYDAQVNFKVALKYAERINFQNGIDKAEAYLIELDSIGVKSNLFKETMNDLNLGNAIRGESQDITLATTIKTAETNEKNGNYYKAIRNYEKAINILKNKGDDEQIAELYRRIADNYKNAGNISNSMEYYNLAIGKKEELGDTTGLQASKKGVEELHSQIEHLTEFQEKDTVAEKEKLAKLESRDDYKMMALELEENQDYQQSLEYYKLYTELNEQIIEDEKQQELDLLEKSYQIESNLQEIQLLIQDKEIQELELQEQQNEILQQNKFRKSLVTGLVLLLALAGALYLLYFNKRRDHKRLNVAHKDLKSTQDMLIGAEKKIKTLLAQQVSTEVARELMSDKADKKIQRKLVCLMFLDIRDFTTFAESRKPEDIIQYQNDVFGFMIDTVYKHHGIINQFLGDGFMATFGAPVSSGNDSENAFLAAMEIIKQVNQKSKLGEIPATRIGIGLHTGMVVVGNVGTDVRKQYSITGNAVIIAARIEQLNKQYKSQLLISEDVFSLIKDGAPKHESLGNVQLKGREKPIQIFKFL